MGTSTPFGGDKNGNPLIPSWLDTPASQPDTNPGPDPRDGQPQAEPTHGPDAPRCPRPLISAQLARSSISGFITAAGIATKMGTGAAFRRIVRAAWGRRLRNRRAAHVGL